MSTPLDWSEYLSRYHADRPGATEDFLTRAHDNARRDPYDWLLTDVPDDGTVLDLACGSGPLHTRCATSWIGIDRSITELQRAQDAGATPIARADAGALPVRTASVATVVSSMALMLLDRSDRVLTELRRILVPGGTLHALLPTTRPLTARDRWRYGALYATLRARAQLPRTAFRCHPVATLRQGGFRVVRDEHARFAYSITGVDAAEVFIDGLYLPTISLARRAAAIQRMARWAGSDLGIALQRIVAIAD